MANAVLLFNNDFWIEITKWQGRFWFQWLCRSHHCDATPWKPLDENDRTAFHVLQKYENISSIWVWLVASPGPRTGTKFLVLAEDWPLTIKNREGHLGIPSDDKRKIWSKISDVQEKGRRGLDSAFFLSELGNIIKMRSLSWATLSSPWGL